MAGYTKRTADEFLAKTANKHGSKATISPSIKAEALRTMKFAPIKYVVPGMIVEGLTLFAGKPKIGKSWLFLHASNAVADGGCTLGNVRCPEGDVLYCALEDNLRRLQDRMTKLLGYATEWPSRLHFRCEMPRLSEGGLDVISQWIKSVEHPRLVIIDALAMIRSPTKKKDQTQYDADYASVVALRDLAHQHGLAIVLVHHLRKQDADDAFDTISGTLGLTGAPDSILVLRRDSTGTFILHGRGRDLVEIEKALIFDKDTCRWRIAGEVGEVRASGARKAVLAALAEIGEPASPADIAAEVGMKAGNVRRLLFKMAKDGLVRRTDYGKYVPQELPV
jgi:hypothetical protein